MVAWMRWVIAFLLAGAPSADAAESPRLWGDLKPGRHAIGFRVVQTESVPGAAGTEPRSIEIAFWYPARAANETPMTFRDYFQLSSALRARSRKSPQDLAATLSV